MTSLSPEEQLLPLCSSLPCTGHHEMVAKVMPAQEPASPAYHLEGPQSQLLKAKGSLLLVQLSGHMETIVLQAEI